MGAHVEGGSVEQITGTGNMALGDIPVCGVVGIRGESASGGEVPTWFWEAPRVVLGWRVELRFRENRDGRGDRWETS
jgi:hypothetical protein